MKKLTLKSPPVKHSSWPCAGHLSVMAWFRQLAYHCGTQHPLERKVLG